MFTVSHIIHGPLSLKAKLIFIKNILATDPKAINEDNKYQVLEESVKKGCSTVIDFLLEKYIFNNDLLFKEYKIINILIENFTHHKERRYLDTLISLLERGINFNTDDVYAAKQIHSLVLQLAKYQHQGINILPKARDILESITVELINTPDKKLNL